MSDYASFLASKEKLAKFREIPETFTSNHAFDYQRAIVRWALRKGRACVFAGTGLGKTIMELIWAQNVVNWTKLPVLIFAPLAVTDQIVDEAAKFGIKAKKAEPGDDFSQPIIFVTNYSKMHLMSGPEWGGDCVG